MKAPTPEEKQAAVDADESVRRELQTAHAVLAEAEARVTSETSARAAHVRTLKAAEAGLATDGTSENAWKKARIEVELADARIRSLTSACDAPRRRVAALEATLDAAARHLADVMKREADARVEAIFDEVHALEAAYFAKYAEAAAVSKLQPARLYEWFVLHAQRRREEAHPKVRTKLDPNAPVNPVAAAERARVWGKLSPEERHMLSFIVVHSPDVAADLGISWTAANPAGWARLARGETDYVSGEVVQSIKHGLVRALNVIEHRSGKIYDPATFERSHVRGWDPSPSPQPDAPPPTRIAL